MGLVGVCKRGFVVLAGLLFWFRGFLSPRRLALLLLARGRLWRLGCITVWL